MPQKSFLHKCSRAHFAVGCTLASLQQLVCGQQPRQTFGYEHSILKVTPYLQTPCHREDIFSRHISQELFLFLFGNNTKGDLGHFNSIHSYRAPQMLLEIFLPVQHLVWADFFESWILNVCWHFEHEEPSAVCVAAPSTKLALVNVKCKSSVKVN